MSICFSSSGWPVFFLECFGLVFGQADVAGGGMPPARSGSSLCGFGFWHVVEGAVAEHCEQGVAASAGEGDQGLVVPPEGVTIQGTLWLLLD